MPSPTAARTARLAVGAALLLTLAGCGPSAEEQRLARALDDTGLALYLPELDEASPTSTRVLEGDLVETTLERDGFLYATLVQRRAPDGDLCRVVDIEPGSTCTVRDGVLRSSFEEMSTVAVVRDETLVQLRSLVTEADPELLDRAADAVRNAPVVTAEDLASY